MTNKKTIRDYVCLMDVEPGSFLFDYMGMRFSFCSQQCRDRFERNPHLYIGRPGQPAPKQYGESIIKRRILKLDHVIVENDILLITEQLQAMMGVKHVSINENIVSITYDLMEVTALQLEKEIEKMGNSLGQDWANQLKRAFTHFVEETRLDNLESISNSHGHYHH